MQTQYTICIIYYNCITHTYVLHTYNIQVPHICDTYIIYTYIFNIQHIHIIYVPLYMRHKIHITYILCTYACTSNTSHMHNMCVCCIHMKYIIYTHICKIHTCNNVSAIENTCYVFNKHIPHVFKCVCVNITYVNNYSVGTYLAHIHG